MKQRLHIKRSIVMNKKRCISVLRGRSDRFQTGYWSGFSERTNSALHHSSDTLKHKVCQLQTHQRADGWPQESISSYQRGRGYEQPDFVQGQVGQNLSLLRKKLGGKLGYSIHILRISARGSEDNIYNEYYRRFEPSVQADYEEQAVIHEWWQPAQNVVFSVAKNCRTLDTKMSKLGHSFEPVIDNIWGQNTGLICPRE